ncbi:MAG: DUF1499 domain-containing protein [Paracoccaceae bacterium]
MGLFGSGWLRRGTDDGRTTSEVVARWFGWGLGFAFIALVAGCVMVWGTGHNPARWHVDPLVAKRTGKPNDYLVAPEGAAAARPDRSFAAVAEPPEALFARFHEIALAAPRTEIVAGAPAELFVTYVQRSAVFGFPDYVSVKAVAAPDGASLAIWSRSRFGYSDLGVNRARVERWLAALDEAAPG